MHHRSQITVVSDRLPFTWQEGSGWARAPGGLVTALGPVVRERGCRWIGFAAAGNGTTPSWSYGPLGVIDVDPSVHDVAVTGYANRVLWPSLHGLAEIARRAPYRWPEYLEYNRAVAATIMESVPVGDPVWIHDYQLFLVPGLLRAARPAQRIGLSVHTPFDLRALSALPDAARLRASIGAADVVGLQRAADRAAMSTFLGSSATTFVSPVSVDVAELERLRDGDTSAAMRQRERSLTGERSLIVGIDRLDYTKAVVERLRGFEYAFARGLMHPDEVRIVQVAQPTRTTIAEYRELRLHTERLGHELSSRWARTDGSSPIELLIESVDRRRVAALLGTADICMVTPYRDGMNLVAKEFSILSDDGVLVLSRGAGAFDELADGAVTIDDVEPASIGGAIGTAMSLSSGRRAEMARWRTAAVRSWTAQSWADAFLSRLCGGVTSEV